MTNDENCSIGGRSKSFKNYISRKKYSASTNNINNNASVSKNNQSIHSARLKNNNNGINNNISNNFDSNFHTNPKRKDIFSNKSIKCQPLSPNCNSINKNSDNKSSFSMVMQNNTTPPLESQRTSQRFQPQHQEAQSGQLLHHRYYRIPVRPTTPSTSSYSLEFLHSVGHHMTIDNNLNHHYGMPYSPLSPAQILPRRYPYNSDQNVNEIYSVYHNNCLNPSNMNPDYRSSCHPMPQKMLYNYHNNSNNNNSKHEFQNSSQCQRTGNSSSNNGNKGINLHASKIQELQDFYHQFKLKSSNNPIPETGTNFIIWNDPNNLNSSRSNNSSKNSGHNTSQKLNNSNQTKSIKNHQNHNNLKYVSTDSKIDLKTKPGKDLYKNSQELAPKLHNAGQSSSDSLCFGNFGKIEINENELSEKEIKCFEYESDQNDSGSPISSVDEVMPKCEPSIKQNSYDSEYGSSDSIHKQVESSMSHSVPFQKQQKSIGNDESILSNETGYVSHCTSNSDDMITGHDGVFGSTNPNPAFWGDVNTIHSVFNPYFFDTFNDNNYELSMISRKSQVVLNHRGAFRGRGRSFFTHSRLNSFSEYIPTPSDKFLAKAHLVEIRESPRYLTNGSKWDNLSKNIWSKFLMAQQTVETFTKKMYLWRFLYLSIKRAYPRYGLYLVGSTITGFGLNSSDVDMCIVSRNATITDARLEALYNLDSIRQYLSSLAVSINEVEFTRSYDNFNLIEAKVPILRFRDPFRNLEIDLNFNNSVGIRNTHLLHCYSQLDWRLRPLVLVVKLWAQCHNINNAKDMTISSYSLVLMVIHFLQCGCNPPLLPCLHKMYPEKFQIIMRSNDFGFVDLTEELPPYQSPNKQTLGELFLQFLEYYSNFDYLQYAISVRAGSVLPIETCRSANSFKNDIYQWRELCIEEPFDLTNTARSVYDYQVFERIKNIFMLSWQLLKQDLDLSLIFIPRETPPHFNFMPQICKELIDTS